MLQPYILLICSIFIAQISFAQEFLYSPASAPIPYRLLTPAKTVPGKSYPLVIFLHGSGERGTDNEAQIKHINELFLNSKNRKKYPCFVLAPQCPNEETWSKDTKLNDYRFPEQMSEPLRHTFDVITHLQKEYPIDNDNIIIMGLSLGGNGVFDAVIRYPAFFSKAVAICGWTEANKLNQRFETEFRLYHGSADATVLPAKSAEAYEALKAAGNKAEYIEYPGVGHSSWHNAFKEPDFLKWMFK